MRSSGKGQSCIPGSGHNKLLRTTWCASSAALASQDSPVLRVSLHFAGLALAARLGIAIRLCVTDCSPFAQGQTAE